MSRAAKTVVVLTFEVCLAIAMAGSFVYFLRESRDFLADRPSAPAELTKAPH
jgi:hypothetical protein